MASFVPMQGRGRGLGRGRGGPSNSPWSNPSPWSKPQQPKPPGPPKQQQQQQSPQHGRGTSNIEVCMDLLSQCVKYTDNLQLKRTEVELIELILPWYTKWMLSENNWLQNNRTVQNSISHFILRDVLLKQPKYKRRELVHQERLRSEVHTGSTLFSSWSRMMSRILSMSANWGLNMASTWQHRTAR